MKKQYECTNIEVINLGTQAVKIRVSEGLAWITHNNRDIALYAGNEITLNASWRPILISSGKENQQVVFTTNRPDYADIREANANTGIVNPLNLVNNLLNVVKS